jgi:hypothetical protein
VQLDARLGCAGSPGTGRVELRGLDTRRRGGTGAALRCNFDARAAGGDRPGFGAWSPPTGVHSERGAGPRLASRGPPHLGSKGSKGVVALPGQRVEPGVKPRTRFKVPLLGSDATGLGPAAQRPCCAAACPARGRRRGWDPRPRSRHCQQDRLACWPTCACNMLRAKQTTLECGMQSASRSTALETRGGAIRRSCRLAF